ncbi:MAG: hypothetical protein ACYC93_15615, partial [Candidatus Acidiferrales bacterium]
MNLFDVVRNVLRLDFQPLFKRHYPFSRMQCSVRPDGIGNIAKNPAGHSPQTHEQSQRFFRALVKVAKRAHPSERIVSEYDRSRFGD